MHDDNALYLQELAEDTDNYTDYCNHESPECRGPVTLWTRPTDSTRWPYCEYHGDRRDRKETQTRRRYR